MQYAKHADRQISANLDDVLSDRAASSSPALGHKQIGTDGGKYNKVKFNVWGRSCLILDSKKAPSSGKGSLICHKFSQLSVSQD